MTDVTDIGEVREEKKFEKRLEEQVEKIRDVDFNGAMDQMMSNEKFSKFARHGEQHMPLTHSLGSGFGSQIFGAIIQELTTAMPLEEAKIYVCNALDWIHDSSTRLHGRAPYPPPAPLCQHEPVVGVPGSVLRDVLRALEGPAVGGDRRADAALLALREALGGDLGLQALKDEFPTLG
jgi:hypothetical protein